VLYNYLITSYTSCMFKQCMISGQADQPIVTIVLLFCQSYGERHAACLAPAATGLHQRRSPVQQLNHRSICRLAAHPGDDAAAADAETVRLVTAATILTSPSWIPTLQP